MTKEKVKTCIRNGKEVKCDLEYSFMTGEIECNVCYAHSNWSSGPIGDKK